MLLRTLLFILVGLGCATAAEAPVVAASWVADALPKEYPHGSNPAAAPPAPLGGGATEKPAGH